MAKNVEQSIIDGMKKLLCTISADKITVTNICDECKINRSTFYYYYKDINQVFDVMLSCLSEQSKKSSQHTMSFYEELLRGYYLIKENMQIIENLYNSKVRERLLGYYYERIEKIFERHICEDTKISNFPKDIIRDAIIFNSNSLFGFFVRWLQGNIIEIKEETIFRLSDFYQMTTKYYVDK